MSKDPAVLFYTGDFLNGCIDLTMEERGQYITLLCLQHQKGHLSEKTIRLSLGSVSVDVLSKFTKDDEGNYFNERMDVEIEKRLQYIDSRKHNGEKGGRPKKAYDKPYGKAYENHSENEDENRIDYESIVSSYHSLCPKLNKVIAISDIRKGYMNARVNEYGIEKVTEVLRLAGESDFLNGKNDRVWKADFDWILRPTNFIKIMEGKYANSAMVKEETFAERKMREIAELNRQLG